MQNVCAGYVADAYAGTDSSKLTEAQMNQRTEFCLNQNSDSTLPAYNTCLQTGVYNNTSSTAASSASGVTCMQRLTELAKACTTATTDATSSCDDSQNSGLAQAQQVAVTLGQQVSSSVTAACSTLGKVMQGANAATAAYQLSCQNSVSTCSSACQTAIQYYNDNKGCSAQNGGIEAGNLSSIQTDKKSCTALSAKASTAQQALTNFLQTTMQAQNCSTATDGTSVADLCTTNPSLAGCSTTVVDCTSAAMATNQVCICQKNPNDASCVAGLSATTVTSSDGTTLASRTASSADSLDGDLYGLPEVQQAAVTSSGSGDVVDGKQGASANISSDGVSSSGAAANAKAAGNGKTANEVPQVTGGFYSGGGGGSSSSGGSGSDNSNQEPGLIEKLAQKAAGAVPDLRQFLPGGTMDPQRGVAGVSGPDGITGPNTDIWKKIQNRYRVVQPSLMP